MFQPLLVVLTGGIVHSKHYLIETGQTTRIKSKYSTMNYLNYFILKVNCNHINKLLGVRLFFII